MNCQHLKTGWAFLAVIFHRICPHHWLNGASVHLWLDPSVFTMSLFHVWSVPRDRFVVIKPSLTWAFQDHLRYDATYLSLLCIPLRHRSVWVIRLLCAVGELDCLPTERHLGEPRRKSYVAIAVFGTTIKFSFTLRSPGRQGISDYDTSAELNLYPDSFLPVSGNNLIWFPCFISYEKTLKSQILFCEFVFFFFLYEVKC